MLGRVNEQIDGGVIDSLREMGKIIFIIYIGGHAIWAQGDRT